MKRFTDRPSPLRRAPVRTWSGFTSSYLRYPVTSTVVFYLLSRIPRLLNTSSVSLIATVHLHIQIPQLVTHSEYLIFTLLFKHTSSDIYALQIYLILLNLLVLQYSTCPIAPGPKITVLSRVEICIIMVIAPSRKPWAAFWFVESTVKCLVNFAFYHQETKYFRWKHRAKMICESSVPNRVGIGTTLL